METSSALADDILEVFKAEFNGPFPYADCRSLISVMGPDYANLIPDLDTYFYDVASPCMGAKKMLRWPYGRLQELRQHLQKSFFDRHPSYRPLETMIKTEGTPHLYAQLATSERLRQNLLKLLFQLMQEQSSRTVLQVQSLETAVARHD